MSKVGTAFVAISRRPIGRQRDDHGATTMMVGGAHEFDNSQVPPQDKGVQLLPDGRHPLVSQPSKVPPGLSLQDPEHEVTTDPPGLPVCVFKR
jgi:hypothetical protein